MTQPANLDQLSLLDALRAADTLERNVVALRERLSALGARGLLRREDVFVYDVLRRKLYYTQQALYGKLLEAARAAAGRVGLTEVASRIPRVELLPALPYDVRHLPSSGHDFRALVGHGNLSGGAVIGGWAAAVLAIGVVVTIATVVAAGAYIASAIVQQLTSIRLLGDYYDRLEALYNQCRAEGRTDCDRIFRELPPPNAVLPRIPDPPDPASPFRWAIGAAVVVGAVATGLWLWRRSS